MGDYSSSDEEHMLPTLCCRSIVSITVVQHCRTLLTVSMFRRPLFMSELILSHLPGHDAHGQGDASEAPRQNRPSYPPYRGKSADDGGTVWGHLLPSCEE